MKLLRRISFFAIFLAVAGAFLTVPHNVGAIGGTHQTPKLLNLWFGWFLTPENIQELKKWDLVVLDMDMQVRNPDGIRELRRLNPKIKIIAYVDSSNIAAGRYVSDSNFPGYKLAHQLPEEWFLHRGKERVGYWPGAWTMNVTQEGPKDRNGKRWNDFLPEFIYQEMWKTGLWDGIFLDNALIGPTWFVGGGLDMTGDGVAEADAKVNEAWKQGWIQMAKNLRARIGSSAIIMGNGAHEYAPYTNGILFEDVPNYGWVEAMKAYTYAVANNQKPVTSAINSNANNVNNSADYRAMRLGFGTSLLDDGYYSFDYGNQDHGQTWWYDEYNATLGNPIGSASLIAPSGASGIAEGVWWREYQNGAVVVNSTWSVQKFDLPGVYERLRGSQDKNTNSGALETSLNIPARDALILYRRTQTASLNRSTSYSNGSFVRVYSENGTQVRSAFFAQNASAPGGATVLVDDVDRDGKQDTIHALNGAITIAYGKGGSDVLRPYGAGYKGAIAIAVGNMDRDASYEIAIGRPGTDEVWILELDGSVRARWHAYTPAFKGGVNVAVGDLDGDGLREIVTGAGPTGGPHIRVFKTDGSLWSTGFFAFDKRERGGVSVALGDVNRDGKDEVIAGSGQGTIPRVRIFSRTGELLREFTLGTSVSSRGITVSIADVDGNGTVEILAGGMAITN